MTHGAKFPRRVQGIVVPGAMQVTPMKDSAPAQGEGDRARVDVSGREELVSGPRALAHRAGRTGWRG